MKHRLIIPVLLLMAFPVRAQFVSMQADATPVFPNAQDSSIVRVYNDQYAVGYIRDSSQGYLYAAEVSGFDTPGASCMTNGIMAVLPISFIVKDMCCIGQIVYLCGRIGTNGFCGWFDIAELLGAPLLNVHYTPLSGSIRSLRKLVVPFFNDPYNSIIDAIGETNGGEDCIVEILNNTTVNMAILPPWLGTNAGQLDDLIVYNERILAVGSSKYVNVSNEAFYVRHFPWGQLADTPDIHQQYVYTTTSGQACPIWGTASTVSDDGKLLVAHDITYDAKCLAVIDIDNNLACEAVHMRQPTRTSYNVSLEFLPSTGEALLNYKVIGNAWSSFLLFRPTLSVAYLSTDSPHYGTVFSSSTRLGGNSIIAVSKNRWELQRQNSYPPYSSCTPINEASVSQIEPYQVSVEQMPIDIITLTQHQYFLPYPIVPFLININCLY